MRGRNCSSTSGSWFCSSTLRDNKEVTLVINRESYVQWLVPRNLSYYIVILSRKAKSYICIQVRKDFASKAQVVFVFITVPNKFLSYSLKVMAVYSHNDEASAKLNEYKCFTRT